MRLSICLCAAVLFVSCGCEGDDGRIKVYPVTGTLTVNGKAADGAYVVFYPTSGDENALRPTATADAQGNLIVTSYETGDGAPAGEYRLSIEWPIRVNNFGRMQRGPDRLAGKFADPEKSGQTVTITEGENVVPAIDLKAEVKDVKSPKSGPNKGD